MTEVASKTGIPNSTLSEIVNGKHKNLSIQKALLICEVVGCSLDYLIDGRQDSDPADVDTKSRNNVNRALEIFESLNPDLQEYAIKQLQLIDELNSNQSPES